jgi:hypothetical protein
MGADEVEYAEQPKTKERGENNQGNFDEEGWQSGQIYITYE